MQKYTNQTSSIKPVELEFTDNRVLEYVNIRESTIKIEEEIFTEFVFDILIYDKDEFIKNQNQTIKNLQNEIDFTQLALCEIYERSDA